MTSNEGNSGTTAFRFTILRTGDTSPTSTVCYSTIDGTAIAPGDYAALVAGPSNCVVFNSGDASKDVVVLVNGDTIVELNETFSFHLISATIGTVSTVDGIGTILNDDSGGGGGNPDGDLNRTALGVPGTGDGFVDVRDSAQFDRFANGLDCPQTTPNEFQRFDDAPLATGGDGRITSSDRTQLDRYIAGLDPLTPAAGPTNPITVTCTATARPETQPEPESEAVAAGRITRLVSASGKAGTDVTVFIESDAIGNELATQYSLNFNPSILSISDASGTNPDVTVGADVPSGTMLTVNARQAALGRIGIVENFNGGGQGTITAGTKRIAKVTFHIMRGAPVGASQVIFDDGVVAKITSDTYGIGLGTTYDQNGVVSVTAAAGITVAGRVTSTDGRGVRNATVTIVDRNGYARTVTTSSFGYYQFDDIAAAGTYTIGVASRQYRFAPRTVQLTDSLTDIDFVGLE